MNSFSNIWNHPRTSAAGILIAVVTVAGVLSQQGIGLGKAGTGNVVTLISGLAAALLGLLARDPVQGSSSGSSAKLGAIALIALLLPLPFVAGCSGTTVAQDIVNWTPALQSAVTTVDSTAAILAPSDAPIFAAATVGFYAASSLLVVQAKAYLANPTASTLTLLQTQIVTLQQQVNVAVLQAVKIVDPASQKHALATIQQVGTVVTAMLSLIESVSTRTQIAQMASASGVKLAAVRPYLDEDRAAGVIAQHYAESPAQARAQVAHFEAGQAGLGF